MEGETDGMCYQGGNRQVNICGGISDSSMI